MENNIEKNRTSWWKKFEKIAVVITLLGTICALYFQFQTKKPEIAFYITSKDYLTSKNNINGLVSNYSYRNIPVENLWLLKFKIVNTGDVTIFGTGDDKTILDSNIVFTFSKEVQILEGYFSQSTFQDHELIVYDSNSLVLNFQQWKKGEYAIYSLYVKSSNKDVDILPKAKRLLKDGNIKIQDLSNNGNKVKQSLLDTYLIYPLPHVFRIIDILILIILLIAINAACFEGILTWVIYLAWKKKNIGKFIEYIDSTSYLLDEENFTKYYTKERFLKDKKDYIEKPYTLERDAFWAKYPGKRPPTLHGVESWYDFWKYILLAIISTIIGVTMILGLWPSLNL